MSERSGTQTRLLDLILSSNHPPQLLGLAILDHTPQLSESNVKSKCTRLPHEGLEVEAAAMKCPEHRYSAIEDHHYIIQATIFGAVPSVYN
jgi:hypothetical protein